MGLSACASQGRTSIVNILPAAPRRVFYYRSAVGLFEVLYAEKIDGVPPPGFSRPKRRRVENLNLLQQGQRANWPGTRRFGQACMGRWMRMRVSRHPRQLAVSPAGFIRTHPDRCVEGFGQLPILADLRARACRRCCQSGTDSNAIARFALKAAGNVL